MLTEVKYKIANPAALNGPQVKIPMSATNFNRNYNSKNVPYEWFDGNLTTYPPVVPNILVPIAERYTLYEFKGLKDVVVNRVRIRDYESNISANPLVVWGVDEYYQKTRLCSFPGTGYNVWRVYDFEPCKVKYLLFTGGGQAAGNTSSEFEVYGSYTEEPIVPKVVTNRSKLKNLCGVNIYEWNLFQSGGSTGAATIDANKLALMSGLGTVRHYLEWDRIENLPGLYTYQPENGGGWYLDAFYQALRDANIEIVTCVQCIPDWLVNTYPSGQRSIENSPMPYGSIKDDPRSYILQAKMGYQLAARYGSNLDINLLGTLNSATELPPSGNDKDAYITKHTSGLDEKLYVWHDSTGNWEPVVTVDTLPRWTNDVRNFLKLELGLVNYLEAGNENNRTWKGRAAYQTPREHAANLSAFYDGHMGKMGPGVGVKNICPSMKVTTCGTAGLDDKYFQGIIDWCKEHRGYNEDGTVNVPFDVINFHTYRNDGGSEQHQGVRTRGSAPEVTAMYEDVVKVTNLAKEYFGDKVEFNLGEIGYDENQSSIQKAIPIGDKPFGVVKADWLLRSSLECGRAGVTYMQVYQMYDDDQTGASTTQYLTSGVANSNLTPRPTLNYMKQVVASWGEFTFNENISMEPRVDKYSLGNEDVYILWSPTENGTTGNYNLSIPDTHSSAILYTLNTDSSIPNNSSLTINTNYNIAISETPVFVKIIKS